MLNNLKKLRQENKYSHQDMAKKIGISKTYYYQIETCTRNLKYELAVKIASIFKLIPDDIFYDDFKNKK